MASKKNGTRAKKKSKAGPKASPANTPWASSETDASLKRRLRNEAASWAMRAHMSASEKDVSVRRILDALSSIVASGDDRALREMDRVARHHIDVTAKENATRSQSLVDLRARVRRWFETGATAAEAAKYFVLDVLSGGELRNMLVRDCNAPTSIADPRVGEITARVASEFANTNDDPEAAIVRGMIAFGVKQSTAYSLFSFEAKRVKR